MGTHATRLMHRALMIAFCVLVLQPIDAQELSYQWTAGKKFSYKVVITADTGDEAITYSGVIHYEVTAVKEGQSNLTYRGGLRETKKVKRRAGGRFGPGGFGPPSFPSPFSRPTFAGKTQTTNRLVLTPRGNVLAMDGDSQLPFLIGNVSILPFESLPEPNQRQWKSDSGVSITEEGNDRRPFGRFGPMGPFGNSDPKSVQAAGEVSSYSIQQTNGNLVTVKKTYRLKSPKTADNEGFDMEGSGTWTFDTADHVPHACDMKISLSVQADNTLTSIPITIKYDRLSDEKLAEMEAETKRRADEAAQAAAEKKAMAEAPLSEEETSDAIAALASNDSARVTETLGKLAGKSLSDPDPDIVDAISVHLKSKNKSVASAADRAMAKWSPEYATVKRLQKAYQGPGAIKSTELYVESTTPLFVGQIVQAQQPRRGSFWRAAKVKRLLPDGKVELSFLTWGKERDVTAVGRRSIQLAPPELPQPDRPASVSSAAPRRRSASAPQSMPDAGGDASQARTWTDVTGRFKVEATFDGLDGDKVRLKRTDGRTMSIPVSKLSDADKAHVDQLNQAENPFQLD